MDKLIKLIKRIKGCKFANVTYQTSGYPKKLLGGTITKVVTNLPIQINYSYENAVNNRLEKQGGKRTFKTDKMSWGKWVKGQKNKLKENNGELYLRVYLIQGKKGEKSYFVNGMPASAEQIATIKAYEMSKYAASGTQGAVGLNENQVKPKDIKLRNILELRVDGQVIQPNKYYEEAR